MNYLAFNQGSSRPIPNAEEVMSGLIHMDLSHVVYLDHQSLCWGTCPCQGLRPADSSTSQVENWQLRLWPQKNWFSNLHHLLTVLEASKETMTLKEKSPTFFPLSWSWRGPWRLCHTNLSFHIWETQGQGSQMTQQKSLWFPSQESCYWTTPLRSISPWEQEIQVAPRAEVLEKYIFEYRYPLEKERDFSTGIWLFCQNLGPLLSLAHL